MRNIRKLVTVAACLLAAGLLFGSVALAQKTTGKAPEPTVAEPKHRSGPRALMQEDVLTPIAKGYDLLRGGKYEAAEYQFKDALSRDRYNPFALNNLAVLQEKNGKFKDALAYLTDAKAHAAEYLEQVEQTCFVGGLCNAVKPLRKLGPTSTVAPIVDENYQKLQDKIAKNPTAPEPSTPPPMK
ncbi:MAG: tetratricopeptide repeat protein [Deltaproteobacteria bacterium]|nr:MAG: tetratricopeptide repeat protein [Deltaproteobacteria bacterium]